MFNTLRAIFFLTGSFKIKGEFHFIARLGCKLVCHLSSTNCKILGAISSEGVVYCQSKMSKSFHL